MSTKAYNNVSSPQVKERKLEIRLSTLCTESCPAVAKSNENTLQSRRL